MAPKLKADQLTARDELRELLPAGTVVYTIVRHTAPSGMSRAISVVYVTASGEIERLDGLIARAGIFKPYPRGAGLKVTGTGMDMGFHVVYTIAGLIHGDGYALTQRWL